MAFTYHLNARSKIFFLIVFAIVIYFFYASSVQLLKRHDSFGIGIQLPFYFLIAAVLVYQIVIQFVSSVIIENDRLIYKKLKKKTIYFNEITGIYEISRTNKKEMPEITSKIPTTNYTPDALYFFGKDSSVLMSIPRILFYKNYEDLFAKLELRSGKKVEQDIKFYDLGTLFKKLFSKPKEDKTGNPG